MVNEMEKFNLRPSEAAKETNFNCKDSEFRLNFILFSRYVENMGKWKAVYKYSGFKSALRDWKLCNFVWAVDQNIIEK